MNKIFAFALTLTLLACQKDEAAVNNQVDVQEEKATLLGYHTHVSGANAAALACVNGYMFKADSGWYSTQALPAPFDKATAGQVNVWLRYRIVANEKCIGDYKAIEVLSIRDR